MKKLIACLVIVLLAVALFACGSGQTGTKKFTIAVIPEGTTQV